MEYPSPEPDSASLLPVPEGDAVTDFLWDSSLFPPFPLDQIFTSELDQQPNLNPAIQAANLHVNSSIGPPTCGAQAAYGRSRGRAGIDLTSNHIPTPGADPRHTVPPGVLRTAAPVPPSVFSGIARAYHAANMPPRVQGHTQSTALSAHPQPSWGLNQPTWPLDASMHWLPVDSNPAQHGPISSPSRFAGPINLGSLPTMGLPFPPVDSVASFSAALAHWAASPNLDHSLNPTSQRSNQLSTPQLNTATQSCDAILSDGGSRLSPNESHTPSWAGASYPLTPISNPSEDNVDYSRRRRESTVSANSTVQAATVPRLSLSKARKQTRQPPSTTAPLAIVQYKPNTGVGTKTSKKRSASEEIIPQGMASQTSRQVPIHDQHGEVKGTIITFGHRTKKRAALSEEQRQRTALTRIEGACPRCKGLKRECDLAHQESPYVGCTRCTCTKIYKNKPRLACFKATLEDILFFRAGPAPNEPFFTKRYTVYSLGDLSKPDVPVRTLKLTQHIGSHQLTVYSSESIPMPGDVVSYKWHDRFGEPHELEMPHFCLTNMEKMRSHFRQYIAAAKWEYLRSLEKEDELAWMTVSIAMEYAKKNPDSLVADCLSLWAISRMIEIPWQMCGSDTLGVSPVQDPTSPHFGKIPIPPTMDTQLDQIVIQSILNPLRARVVQKFEQRISPARPETWWEVYLSSFILLNHIERLARHSVFHARTHTMASKYSNIPFLEAVFHTAKSILARFHFVCNGSVPLRLDWTSPKVAKMAKLEPKQVEFMRKTQAMIAAREQDVLSLRNTHKYERSLYWAGQLFTESFDTSPVHVVEEVDDEDE